MSKAARIARARKAGLARAAKLTAKERKAIAAAGAEALFGGMPKADRRERAKRAIEARWKKARKAMRR
jgi:hypothetical protein